MTRHFPLLQENTTLTSYQFGGKKLSQTHTATYLLTSIIQNNNTFDRFATFCAFVDFWLTGQSWLSWTTANRDFQRSTLEKVRDSCIQKLQRNMKKGNPSNTYFFNTYFFSRLQIAEAFQTFREMFSIQDIQGNI